MVGGTVTVNENNEVIFTPDPDFTGEASYTYTVVTADGTAESATVNIEVLDPNDFEDSVIESVVIADDKLLVTPVNPDANNTPDNVYGVEAGTFGQDYQFSGDVSDQDGVLDTTGLTNDETPTLTITLSGPLKPNQALEIVRYIEDEDRGGRTEETIVANQSDLSLVEVIGGDPNDPTVGKYVYEFTDSIVPNVNGSKYVYDTKVVEKDAGPDATPTSEKSASLVLDTVADAPVITGYQVDGDIGVVKGMYGEEGVIFVDANKNGILDEGESSAVVDKDTGEWTLTLTAEETAMMADVQNYDRKPNRTGRPDEDADAYDTYLPLSFVDKAGNILDGYSELYVFDNSDGTALLGDDGVLYVNDRPETASYREESVNGGTAYIIDFDQNDNGQIIYINGKTAAPGLGGGNVFEVYTGKGDDVVNQVGTLQANTNFYMGEGNDVLLTDRASGTSGSRVNIDMGNGNNKVLVVGGSNTAVSQADVTALEGNDLLEVTNGGSIINSNINLGDGNNVVKANNLRTNNTINTGKDADKLLIDGYINNNTINL